MNFDLTDEQSDIQRLAREFAEQEVKPVAEELDRENRFPYEIVEKLAELGLMGMPYPEEYGGGGADNLSYAHRHRGARAGRLVGRDHGRRPHLARHLADLRLRHRRAEARVAAAPVQRASGWRPSASPSPRRAPTPATCAPRAELDDGEWVIDGAKQFITNAGTDISGCVTITALTGDGHEISNIIVPTGTPGYEIGEPYRKMGWNASDTRPLAFDDCRVPEENLLGPRGMGFKQFLQTLDGGRIGVAAMGVGLAQGALDEALAYAKERRAFGQPIAKFQAIQTKLADMSTEIEAARLLTYKAALAQGRRAATSR